MQINKALKNIKLRIKKSFEIYEYYVDFKRYHQFANFGYNYVNDETKLLSMIAKYYHIVEKGLSMPDTRFGFGSVVIYNILDFCDSYIEKGFDKNKFELIYAVKVLNEYLNFHLINNYQIEDKIRSRINNISQLINIVEPSHQNLSTSNDFFKFHDSPFEQFAYSRHSCRNYTDKEVSNEILKKCIQIAQTSPSACNRQPNRVYVATDKQLINKILTLQSGNRGFGHLSNKLIILTSDIRVFARSYEKYAPHFNSGMFAMSLIYALHYYEVGCCALNWSTSYKNDNQLRSILNIPNYEYITLIISCGYPPEEFKYANSPKKSFTEITNFFNSI